MIDQLTDEQLHYFEAWKKEKALADKRLELLRLYDGWLQSEPDCFSCGLMTFNEDSGWWEHTDGCELAEELGEREDAG
jgi:hypothetical protein